MDKIEFLNLDSDMQMQLCVESLIYVIICEGILSEMGFSDLKIEVIKIILGLYKDGELVLRNENEVEMRVFSDILS